MKVYHGTFARLAFAESTHIYPLESTGTTHTCLLPKHQYSDGLSHNPCIRIRGITSEVIRNASLGPVPQVYTV